MAEISPAILTNDISDFRIKYAELFALSHHFRKLHVDFADGQFVNNQTIMPHDLKFLKSSPFILMAHFMTFKPQKYFWDAKKAGFKWVLVHYEAFEDSDELDHVLEHARSMHFKVGIVLNPETPLHKAAKFIQKVDCVQLMCIEPGFQGREFMPSTLDRIKELRDLMKHAIIAVDGGVKVGIAHKLAKAGADVIVAGSAIVKSYNRKTAIEALKEDIEL
ncbi:MAG: ribulose-phosphate 3-epimerase [Candidatus Doudnabacteria bacterium]|nr:ribulose-phosphate 3-epimerase [Candidatus Doudnabacteria bacterium]